MVTVALYLKSFCYCWRQKNRWATFLCLAKEERHFSPLPLSPHPAFTTSSFLSLDIFKSSKTKRSWPFHQVTGHQRGGKKSLLWIIDPYGNTSLPTSVKKIFTTALYVRVPTLFLPSPAH